MSFAVRRLVPLSTRWTSGEQLAQGVRQSRRGYADAHGEAKVNAWEAPTQIGRWKEEHIVFAVLGGWAIGIFGARKVFGGKTPTAQAEQSDSQPEPTGPEPPKPPKH